MNHRKYDWSWLTITLACLLLVAGLVAGCGDDAAEEEDVAVEAEEEAMEYTEDAEDAEDAEDDGAPRVFFANLSEGDEVTSPVSIEFGIANFEIVPAVDPVVIEDGKGHHHLAINAHCLPAGEVIEKADPWIHFGDGSNTIDVQLEPGPAHLSLQVGDGEHRTLDEPGLCAMISFTVIQEGV